VVSVFERGERIGQTCASEANRRGYTVLDLSDDWAPVLFSEDPALGPRGLQPYRSTYIALARERFGSGPEWKYAREDRHFELYGIPPALSLVRDRLADERRHRCHDAIDDGAIAAFTAGLREQNNPAVRALQVRLQRLQAAVDKQRAQQPAPSGATAGPNPAAGGAPPVPDRAASSPALASQQAELEQLQLQVAAVTALQQHLVCDGQLGRGYFTGYFDWRTAQAAGRFQRLHGLMADESYGPVTRNALLMSSRERDFHTALRVLRERVVDATGVIEDGSAGNTVGTVLGRHLDSEPFRRATRHPLPDDPAPDLLSRFTEAAAVELGWRDPAATRAFLERHLGAAATLRVAVRLPPVPDYHTPEMELHAVIDRGDVWYDLPPGYTRGCAAYHGERGPVLTLYAVTPARRIALLRWHTTIGGWNQEELPSGWTALRYKESDVGRRVWRDLVAAPAWIAPPSTPDAELVRRAGKDYEVKADTIGPSYRSAYGLVMLVHHQVHTRRNGEQSFFDNGIRTHGSANYQSVLRGCSHGCHRLFNQQAVRLATFLLKHRKFVRHGRMTLRFDRIVRYRGKQFRVSIPDRGYRYELDPPVVVDVLEGRIRGQRKQPLARAVPLPATAARAAGAQRSRPPLPPAGHATRAAVSPALPSLAPRLDAPAAPTPLARGENLPAAVGTPSNAR
jgi:hypothetical protein